MAGSDVKLLNLGSFLELCTERNKHLLYGVEDAVGVNIEKKMQKMRANIDPTKIDNFFLVKPGYFVFNQRGSRKLGLGYNFSEKTYITTYDHVVFKIREDKLDILDPIYLYMYLSRKEWDRYAEYVSWGSSTEYFRWSNLCETNILLPSIVKQREIVAEWKDLREMKEQNEQIAYPLMELCQSYIEECKKKYPITEIGPYITRSDSKNSDNKIKIVKSVSVTKAFNDTNAKVDKNNLKGYKIVKPGQISFVQTTGNEKCLCIAVNHFDYPIVVTSVNEVFETNQDKLLADYLHLYCCRKETDRYVRFHSWGSARETFTWLDMCRFKIPLPPIDVQQAIVNIYKSAQEAKKIAEEADKLSNEICPALIQHVIHS